jgi:hypothetical protein
MVCRNVFGLLVKLSLLAMMYSAPPRPNKLYGIECLCLGTGYEWAGLTCSLISSSARNTGESLYIKQSSCRWECVNRASDLHHFHHLYVTARYCWPVVRTAHAMRASLLASATTATFECFLSPS